MAVILDFYSIIVELSGNDEEVIHRLSQEFRYFYPPLGQISTPEIKIRFHDETFSPETLPALSAHKITQNAIVFRLGQTRYIQYQDAWSVFDENRLTADLYSRDKNILFELGYLAVHSLIGEKLESKGLIRLHAMALETANYQLLIMLPSRGGKSTLLTSLLEKYPNWKIISDDMPLISLSGEVYSFPSKISLDQPLQTGIWEKVSWEKFERASYPAKWMCSVMDLPHGISKNSNKPILLIQGERLSSGQPLISQIGFLAMMKALSTHMIIGVGLPIILEYFLKFQFSDIFKLIYLGLKRMTAAIILSFKAKKLTFYLSPDKKKNIELLGKYLNE